MNRNPEVGAKAKAAMEAAYNKGCKDGAVAALQGGATTIHEALLMIDGEGELDGAPIPREEVTSMLQAIARSWNEATARIGES